MAGRSGSNWGFLLGVAMHPAFLLVALFGALVAGVSAYIVSVRAADAKKLASGDNGDDAKTLKPARKAG